MDRKEKITGIVTAVAVALSSAACCDSAPIPDTGASLSASNCTIATLRELYDGHTRLLDGDIRIAGRVTTSDDEANFYKSIVVEDGSGAVEIMAGITDLATIYPAGVELGIDLRGCALGQSYGVMQIGRYPAPYSGYATDYFSSRVLLDRHITRGDEIAAVESTPVAISDLRREMCGRLVTIDSLLLRQPVLDDEYAAPAVWSGYATFDDQSGDSIVVYTRRYADYADHRIPDGHVELTGILQYGKSGGSRECFQLKMRHESDCRAY